MAEIDELKEKLEALEKVRENLLKKRDNTTEKVDEMKYYTIGGVILAAYDDSSIKYVQPTDTTHMPFKWVRKSWKYLVSPEFPHGVVTNVLALLQLLLSVTFLIATAPIWIIDNTVSGSVFLLNKAALKGDIKATEKKLDVVDEQINSIVAEIRNAKRATKLANTLKSEPKHISQVEVKQTEQSEKSEENGQGK